jgi:hypothetical protein
MAIAQGAGLRPAPAARGQSAAPQAARSKALSEPRPPSDGPNGGVADSLD